MLDLIGRPGLEGLGGGASPMFVRRESARREGKDTLLIMSLQETKRPRLRPIDPDSISGTSGIVSDSDLASVRRAGPAVPQFTATDAPLYRQLSTILKEQILTGALAPGDQLPTEAKLVDAYRVSRITVRQALKILAEERLIRREAGRGTFVLENRGRLPEAYRLNGSMADLVAMEQGTEEKLLDRRDVAAEPKDQEIFDLGEEEQVTRCERLQFLGKEPFGLSINRLPPDIVTKLHPDDWQEGSLFHALTQRLEERLLLAEQTIRATLADATLARLLRVHIGAPVLAVERLIRASTGRAVARVSSRYRADLFSLNVQFEPNVRESAAKE